MERRLRIIGRRRSRSRDRECGDRKAAPRRRRADTTNPGSSGGRDHLQASGVCRVWTGSGDGIRTRDLWVMSPTSYRTAPPRNQTVDSTLLERPPAVKLPPPCPGSPYLSSFKRHGHDRGLARVDALLPALRARHSACCPRSRLHPGQHAGPLSPGPAPASQIHSRLTPANRLKQ